MASLSDDKLRFIIDVDAKGAQRQIASLSVETGKLEVQYKKLSNQLSAADKEVNRYKNRLAELEKRGSENTKQADTYRKRLMEATRTQTQLRKELASTATILDRAKEKQAALTGSLKLSEMTMKQLRERLAQLKKQLDLTSKSASPDVYQKLQREYAQTATQLKKMETAQFMVNKAITDGRNMLLGFIKQGALGIIFAAAQKLFEYVIKRIERLRELQNLSKNITQEANKQYSEQASKVAALEAVMRDENAAYATRLKALDDLKKIIPDYHGSLTKEGKLINDNKTAIDEYNAALYQQIQLQAAQEKLQKAYSKQLEKQFEVADLEKEYNTNLENANNVQQQGSNTSFSFGAGAAQGLSYTTQAIDVEFSESRLQKAREELDDINEEINRIQKHINALPTDKIKQTTTTTTEPTDPAGEATDPDAAYKERLKTEEKLLKQHILEETQLLAADAITKEELQDRVLQHQRDYYETLLQIAQENGTDTTDIEQKIADLTIQQNERKIASEEAYRKALQQTSDELEKQKSNLEKVADAAKAAADAMQSGLGKDLMKTVGSITSGIQQMQDSIEKYQAQAAAGFENAHDKAVALSNAIASSTTAVGNSILSTLSTVQSTMDTIFEMETAKLEEEKNKQLENVSDNAEEKERVEREYEEKALELKKKKAKADAAVQSAQLWVSTAMGVVNAWSSSMQLPFPANVIVGGVLTAALLAMAGVEQANIVKQTKAITSTTLDSSSASSSAATAPVPSTTTINDEYKTDGNADGSPVENTGFASGGYTGNGAKYQPAGIVHKGEYVVAREELHQPRFAAMVRQIDAARTHRLAHAPLPPSTLEGENHAAHSFADGGYTNGRNNDISTYRNNDGSEYRNNEITIYRQIEQTLAALQQTLAAGITAEVNYQQFQNASAKIEQAKKLASR